MDLATASYIGDLVIVQLVCVHSLVIVCQNGPKAILVSKASILSLAGATKILLAWQIFHADGMNHVQHPAYIGSPHDACVGVCCNQVRCCSLTRYYTQCMGVLRIFWYKILHGLFSLY